MKEEDHGKKGTKRKFEKELIIATGFIVVY